MYIYIFDDYEIRYSTVDPTTEDFEMTEEGILDIIKLPTNGHDGPPTQWIASMNAWLPLKRVTPYTEIDD